MSGDDEKAPALRIVHGGEPSDEELAALAAGFAVLAAQRRQAGERRVTSQWASRQRGLRRPLTPGPGAWRASAWPDH